MIRPAEMRDLAALVDMGRAFHAEAGWPDMIEWDDVAAAQSLARMMGHPDFVLLVVEDAGAVVAMAAAIFSTVWFNSAQASAQELFWYVRPAARKGIGAALLAALETAVAARGVRTFTMLAVTGLRSDALARIYARRGYRPAERTFIRRM